MPPTTNLLITDGSQNTTAVYVTNGTSDGTEVGAGSALTTPSAPPAQFLSDLTTIGSDVFEFGDAALITCSLLEKN